MGVQGLSLALLGNAVAWGGFFYCYEKIKVEYSAIQSMVYQPRFVRVIVEMSGVAEPGRRVILLFCSLRRPAVDA